MTSTEMVLPTSVVPTTWDPNTAALMEFALSYNVYEVHDDFDAVAEISDVVRLSSRSRT